MKLIKYTEINEKEFDSYTNEGENSGKKDVFSRFKNEYTLN